MFCKNCGNSLEEGAKYCGICGSKVNSEKEEGGQKKKSKKKTTFFIGLSIALVTVLAAGCLILAMTIKNQELETITIKDIMSNKKGNSSGSGKSEPDVQDEKLLSGKYYATIKIKDYGSLEVELDADTAPITVTNFVKLVQEHFYDGLTFHRVMDGFIIQGGDPLGNGKGGSDTKIKGEFENNGVQNSLSHTRGAVSMARMSDYDSATSQFFIVQSDSTSLDGDYAVFGYVKEGMEIVDRICRDIKPIDDNGTVPKARQPVIESVVIKNNGSEEN